MRAADHRSLITSPTSRLAIAAGRKPRVQLRTQWLSARHTTPLLTGRYLIDRTYPGHCHSRSGFSSRWLPLLP
ncbi:hypothetical protein VTI74DRAFT_4055 [Chaetomium olivicolor]